MAEYKAIRGHTIRTVAGDPDPLVTGDIWYSNTAKKIRGAKIGAGAWATGGNLNTGRQGTSPSQQGTQTAAMAISGGTPSNTVNVEQYDGSSWTEIANVNTSRQGGGGAGTTTAALDIGGNGPVLIVEEWDNSSWTEVGDLNSAPGGSATATGTSTAAIRMGGYPVATHTETWNGTSWTEVGDLNTARGGGSGVGTTTAANFAGGGYPAKGNVEQWNGSAWTEIADITARSDNGAAGTQDYMLVMGGSPNTTESWDGSSWTEVADMATAREGHKGCGTGDSAVTWGGGAPVNQSTEEWTKAVAASSFTSS